MSSPAFLYFPSEIGQDHVDGTGDQIMDPFALMLTAALIASPEVCWDLCHITETDEGINGPLWKGTVLAARKQCQEEWHRWTADSIQLLGVGWEILDVRECKHLFIEPGEFHGDLKLLQNRFRALAQAPPLADCGRFPSREMVNEFLNFNRLYQRDLEARLAVDLVHDQQVRAALKESEQLYHIWDKVRTVRCGYYYISVRREALQELRDLVGESAFYSGHLPPHVPVWRIPSRSKK
jgi:hypothetical protein